ncbi:MAG: 16S rRNA (cytosine(1402)-N(4))-methyltransferase RsmH [Candidatus Liptonbacteria bacterium]|nr:16S rRNA (cytosine(1402)-N(4))-methyltransferase RsmH [Candidatus Liptonbacteria bacterium]
MHIPVLLKEVIEYLNPEPGEFIIDGTINGGGHAKIILDKISPSGKVFGIDWDESLIKKLKRESWVIGHKSSITLISGNYADLPEILKKEKLGKADGLLLDLGFSSEQIENSNRGFSFDKDEPLYMTYSAESAPVAQVIRELKEGELADIIFKLGGERLSRKIAKAIKEVSKKKRITSSLELAEIIRASTPKNYENQRIDPATRTFQALRIYANHELENLEKVLNRLPDILKPKARVVIISFHSLEDAIIKKHFQKLELAGILKILTKKPIEASMEEIVQNPKSRSAKLRAAILI